MNSLNDHCIKVCNSLLRGEISAVEAYGQAIEKYPGTPAAEEFRRIRAEHSKSANRLSADVREMGGEPDSDSGAWGVFAVSVQGTANLFGEDSAISALQKGEELGRKDYQDAMMDDEVMPECKNMISKELLPRVLDHIVILENLGQTV
ncbi:MAG: DUF2383 domain-containing protein [Luteolibacter sp.]